MSADGRGSNTGLPDSRDAYHSIIDTAYIGDWFHNPETQLSQTSGVSERVPATLVLYADQAGPFHARYFSGIEKRWVSLHSRNRIRCSGSLPPWPLPRPLRAVLYSSPPRQAFSVEPLQLLCATALSGGHPSANAGGLCLNHHPGLGPIVGFSDTWGVSDALSEAQLMDSMAIRIWCAKHCSCNGRDSSELPEKINGVVVPGKIWEGDADVEFGSSSIKVSPNGQNSFKFWPAGYGGQKRGGIQRGIGGGTATNDDIGDGKEVFAGQFDKALNAISTSSRGTIRGNVKPQCGGRCRGPTDCSSGGEEGTECVCSVDPATIRQKGLDPVFPVAACLAFSVVMNGRKGLKLWGRGEESWPCVCNASYVSSGCCGSVDGLVWDDHGGKIGSLLI
ncbi:MAG: hypothetical protein M1814_004655 [Vezdaea aestivalis]|nr:MAG: hypothetical protein M1814_004655 [Vezdaea aestivalis]